MVAVLLAILVIVAGPVQERVDLAVYDALQRYAGGSGSAGVVVVDATGLEGPDGSLWSGDRFPELLHLATISQARLVVPAQPAPRGTGLAKIGRLTELQALEQQASGSTQDTPRNRAFSRQIALLQRQYDQQLRILAAIGSTRSLILPVAVDDATTGYSATPGCVAQWLQVQGSSDADIGRVMPVGTVVDPGEDLCRASGGVGYLQSWPDEDGVFRREHLAVRANGGVVPSLALAAMLAEDGKAPLAKVVRGRLNTAGLSIATSSGLTVFRRHYEPASRNHGFRIYRAADLLDGRLAPAALADKIVVISAPGGDSEPRQATPADAAMPASLLLATSISNLVEQDYIVRPDWLVWIEGLLLIASCILLVSAGPRTPVAVLLMMTVSAAAVLLALEAWLLLEEGVWLQAGSIAAYVLGTGTVMQLARIPGALPHRAARTAPGAAADPVPESPAPPTPVAVEAGEDQLELAFSVLRQQPGSERVKDRLYDIAVTHVRQRDLARAERVLRYLAALDPNYRNVSDKLRKLAGLQAGVRDELVTDESDTARIEEQPQVREPVRRNLGRYELERVIGRGAMATVYLGRDPKINRKVAIKTIALAEEFSDSELANARGQFVREAESAGRLNHPGIITVYDVGDDDNIAYLAMEYFPGKSLGQYAQQGRLLPPKKALELIARAADALHYAHGQGVVHRDIKPANLLYDAETDSLKITDFGIARLTDSSRTKTGIILGTPSYMSPEQLGGMEVTGRSDIFSLGITLYQLLAGLPPFRADSIPRLMQCITREKHEPVRSLRADVPAEVDEILERALAKSPDERFPSARAMALALRDCCSRFGTQNAMRA